MAAHLKEYFYLSQLVLAIGFLVIAWFFFRPKSSDSNFRVRESDLRKPGPKLNHASEDSLAQSKIKKQKPLSLPGISIDAPAHQILGITADSSVETIQKAYRDLIKRYHPDRVGRPGSREWQDAQKIADAINRAKEQMLKNKK